MKREAALAWLGKPGDLVVTKALQQHWEKRRYSYLTRPRPDFGLMLLLSGHVDFVADGETVSARAGDVVFLPKRSAYEAVFVDKADDYLICFDADGEVAEVHTPTVLLNAASMFCAERFRVLAEENIYGTGTLLSNKGLLYLLLNGIVTEAAAQGDGHHYILKRACEMLQRDEGLSVDEVAKACAVSGSTLRQIFKSRLGMSPTEYRTDMKLRRAMYLIESTDLTVSEIAERLAFFDAAYFCKLFKKRTGRTPGDYAKNKKL